MTTAPEKSGVDTDHLGELGDAQQLPRGLGPSASSAAVFSFVSILTTVAYALVRRQGTRPPGPASPGTRSPDPGSPATVDAGGAGS